jgi:hypothetical protein
MRIEIANMQHASMDLSQAYRAANQVSNLNFVSIMRLSGCNLHAPSPGHQGHQMHTLSSSYPT